VGFAGGFNAYNMSSQGGKPEKQPLTEKRYSMSVLQTMKNVLSYQESSLLSEGNVGPPAAGLSFLDGLNEEEKLALTRKLVQPPPQSKLKHMIDDLY
jgi:hypothetical protein